MMVRRLSPKQKLFKAIEDNDLDAANAVLARSKHPEKLFCSFNSAGETPLHAACWNERFEIAAVLLNAGAEIDVWDEYGQTALHDACRNGLPSAVRFLLQHGAGLYERDNALLCATTPIDLALREYNWEGNTNGRQIYIEILEAFFEAAPEETFNEVLSMPDDNPGKQILLDWFQQFAPELYFSAFCTTNTSPGGGL